MHVDVLHLNWQCIALTPARTTLLLQLWGTGLSAGCSSSTLHGRSKRESVSVLHTWPSKHEGAWWQQKHDSQCLTSPGGSSLPGLPVWGFKEHHFLTAERSSPPGHVSLATWVCSPCVADQEWPSLEAPHSTPGYLAVLAPGDSHQAKATGAMSARTLFVKGQVLNMLYVVAAVNHQGTWWWRLLQFSALLAAVTTGCCSAAHIYCTTSF